MAGNTIRNQGLIIVEPSDDGFLMLLPDGNVACVATRLGAETKARRWFKEHLAGAAVGIGRIEWRP